jgi:hypothetical protein
MSLYEKPCYLFSVPNFDSLGGELGRGIGYGKLNQFCIGYVLAITITIIALGQSANRAIIILHDTLSYGFLFTQPRREDSDELFSPLPTKTTRMTDDGRRESIP